MGLLLRQGQEQLHVVTVRQLAGLGGYSSEENCGKGARLCATGQHMKMLVPWDNMESYRGIAGALELLYKAHQEDLRPCSLPVAGQMFLGLGANIVVGRLQGLQQLGQLSLDIRGKNRHRVSDAGR